MVLPRVAISFCRDLANKQDGEVVMKFFKRAKPVRKKNLIRLYDDTVRINKQPKIGGLWCIYKLKDDKPFPRFHKMCQAKDLDTAMRLAKKV